MAFKFLIPPSKKRFFNKIGIILLSKFIIWKLSISNPNIELIHFIIAL